MAWCKVSSLTSAVAVSLRGMNYPVEKSKIIASTDGKTVEGWELGFFLRQALVHKRYRDLRSVMTDLEDWLERQG
ncbi:MAG: hypothetical protein LYZ70_04340 [Nitrososphaerales archaeon]|nr:hypothetical protein [Nitrososphaerales archaeon]